MKYIQYTYVDVKTNKPVSQEPAKRGPVHPQGVTPTFALESTFSSGIPTFFGIAEDTFTPEEWMREVPESEFYNRMRVEFKERARKKRKEVEKSGLEVFPGVFVKTTIDDQNRISSLVAAINNDPDLTSIDFETSPGNWAVLTAEEGLEIGKAVSQHVQSCFTWCKGIHERLDDITTLDEALPIVQEIRDFGKVADETVS